MNAAAWSVLQEEYRCSYIEPRRVTRDLAGAVQSKLSKLAGIPRTFYTYSERRLASIKSSVERSLNGNSADFAFFHGFTPWIKVRPQVPYLAWSDCTFSEYVRTYHNRAEFSARDLDRICQQEARWLLESQRVIFRSHYAAERAMEDYGLPPASVGVVGTYGRIPMPSEDRYAGSKHFLFIATNFELKGGRVAVEATAQVRAQGRDATLVIVGQRPPEDVLTLPYVKYAGWLEKSAPEQLKTLIDWMAGAIALVHPTTADMNPLTVFEAAYHGCPAIASNRFAIPEFVHDSVNGLLLDDPRSATELARKMLAVLNMSNSSYQALRRSAWTSSRSEATETAFNGRLTREIRVAVGEPPMRDQDMDS